MVNNLLILAQISATPTPISSGAIYDAGLLQGLVGALIGGLLAAAATFFATHHGAKLALANALKLQNVHEEARRMEEKRRRDDVAEQEVDRRDYAAQKEVRLDRTEIYGRFRGLRWQLVGMQRLRLSAQANLVYHTEFLNRALPHALATSNVDHNAERDRWLATANRLLEELYGLVREKEQLLALLPRSFEMTAALQERVAAARELNVAEFEGLLASIESIPALEGLKGWRDQMSLTLAEQVETKLAPLAEVEVILAGQTFAVARTAGRS